MKFNRLMAATVLVGLSAAPVYASNYCIAVGGGFGTGGTSFIGQGFEPEAGKCAPWSGFTKTADTVVLTTSGVGCTSSDGKVLTVSVSSADPSYFNQPVSDYIQLCPKGASHCPIGSGRDTGGLGGPAAPETCTSELLELPSKHD